MPDVQTFLIVALTALAIVSLILQMRSREEVRKLRATVDLMGSNQMDVLAEAERVQKMLTMGTAELDGVLIDLTKHYHRNSQSA